jgi:hypothetical protein
VDEAKAAFNSALEQVGSRKQRFTEHGAVDLSALVGGGAGLQVDWSGGGTP